MKFILHGGISKGQNPLKDIWGFFLEMAKDFSDPRILLIYFASEPKKYNDLFEQDVQNFKLILPKKKFSFTLATIEHFKDQVSNSDVLYFHGGSTTRLIAEIEKIANFKEIIKDKVYAGSSAGVNAIAKYCFSPGINAVRKSLGIIPIKTFPHWDETKLDELVLLEKTGESLPVYKLKEGEFVVLNFDIK